MIGAIAAVAEERIRQAMEQGAFENLPGQGKPMDADDAAHVPPELRMAWRLLKNGGYLDDARAADPAAVGNLEGMLGGNQAERLTLRRMLKLQVIEARCRSQGKALRLDGEDSYQERIVERIAVRSRG